jgi:hypothetical protein
MVAAVASAQKIAVMQSLGSAVAQRLKSRCAVLFDMVNAFGRVRCAVAADLREWGLSIAGNFRGL